MSDIIKLLPDSVANQIAAGEVIQRPASVIKELVENAVDAGAHHIQIFIKDAGRTLIQVIDDGSGMSETDARMAFERHATSKITNANDLYSLNTMGFRGEALPSIAAVSQIDLRTMPHGETLGTRLLINASKVESQEPETCAPGTNMMVKNLFFNIPVRRKFLKKDAVELSNILREFERLALVNTDIEFSISHNDTLIHHLLAETFKRRIIALFGKSLEHQLIPVETDTSLVRMSGYIGLPQSARRRNALQYLTVNGRNMRHPYFHKAIMQCYADLIPADTQPNYFINFIVDPETIDVNIHPTKNEIKFENEQPIWQILTATIKESLNRFNAVPAIEFDCTDAPDIPAFNPDRTAPHNIELDTTYNPFNETTPRQPVSTGSSNAKASNSFNSLPQRQSVTDWEKLYEEFNTKREESFAEINDFMDTSSTSLQLIDDENSDFSSVGTIQIKNKYIVAPSRAGMIIIDQHRAHLLVLYNEYLERMKHKTFESQQILFPETLDLTGSQNAIFESIIDNLREIGFNFESQGKDEWTITGVPSVISHLNTSDILQKMIETVTETGEDISADLYKHVALAMANATAIRGNRPLSSGEREQLLASLLSLASPMYTPEGNRVMATISMEDIAKML